MGSKRKRAPKETGHFGQPSHKKSKNDLSLHQSASERAAAHKAFLSEKSLFSDHPTGQERKREATLYEILGSEDDAGRLKAAGAIISSLFDGEGVPESVLQRHLEKRLFRGLASGRNASRLGFSLVITEVLTQLYGSKNLAASRYDGLGFEKVLDFMVEKTHAGGNIPGQEERDHYLGQLFGIECFVKAGILGPNQAWWHAILDLLLRLANKKVWLRSQCGWVIVEALLDLPERSAEATIQKLADAGLAKTPEGVGIWVVALQKFPDMKLPSKPWRDPLSSKSLQELPPVLKEGGRDQTNSENGVSGKQKQQNWTAQLHFVWGIILRHFVTTFSNQVDGVEEQFRLFWGRVIDEGFFSKNASENQKFSGFMIFQKFLEDGPECPFIIKNLFSKNLLLCLMNQAAREDRYLHRAAIKALKAVESCVEAKPELLAPVLDQLLGAHGAYNFDQRTGTKTIDHLLQHVADENAAEVLGILRQRMPSEGDDSDDDRHRQAFGDYVAKVAISSSEAIQVLASIAHSKSDPIHVASSDKTREIFRARLSTALSKVVRRPEDFAQVCQAVLAIDASSMEMDDDIKDVLQSSLKSLKKLAKQDQKSKETRSHVQGLALLYAVSTLQLYNGETDAVQVLVDLLEFQDKLNDKKLDKEAESSAFLVEILLSLVARPSSLLRQTSQRVFEAFTSQMTAESLKMLTDNLVAEENAKGKQALFSGEDEDEVMGDGDESGSSSEDDENDGHEIDSDVEFVELKNGVEEESSDEDSSEVSSEDEDEQTNGEPAADDQAKDDKTDENVELQLGQILNSHRLDKDAEAEDTSDDSDMSDSDMIALDEKLAAVFKQRTQIPNKRKENKEAKELVVNFKHRVLDLLDTFVRKEAPGPLAFPVLLPLLELMQTTTTKALGSRAYEIILNFQKAQKKARANSNRDKAGATPAATKEQHDYASAQVALMSKVHEVALRGGSHAFARAASTASLLVVSSIYAADMESMEDVFEGYMRMQRMWFVGGALLHPSFFTDWVNWCQAHLSAANA